MTLIFLAKHHHLSIYLLNSSKSSNKSWWPIMQVPRLNQGTISIFTGTKRPGSYWFSPSVLSSSLKMSISAPNCVSLDQRYSENTDRTHPKALNIRKTLAWSTFKWQLASDSMKKTLYIGQQTFMQTSGIKMFNLSFSVGSNFHFWCWVNFSSKIKKLC